jgi:hypothetical protein
MRAMHRVVLLAALAAFSSTLTACSNFDPDKLDVFGLNEKKKLPGERKELFPGGVPGVTQGIPPEFVKGNQPPPDVAQTPAGQPGSPAAAEPDKKTAAVEPEEKPKPKRKPKPRTVAQPPAQGAPQGAAQQQPAPWPQQSQQPQQAQAPWPGQAQGQSNASAPAPWPSSPSTVAR